MDQDKRLTQIEELLATELKRLDKQDTQILIGWIIAGASLVTAMLALYSVLYFHYNA